MMDALPSRISVAHASRFSAGEPVGDTTALGRRCVFLLTGAFRP
jgi:hypothetical protein